MGEVVREKKLMDKIECGLVVALRRSLKRPVALVGKLTGFDKNEIRKRVRKIKYLDDCFEPWLSEEIIGAARRIKNKKTYGLEKQQLYKLLNPVDEDAMCEEAVNASYKMLYAGNMATLWNKLNTERKAFIYQFKIEIPAAKRLEGNFIKIPEENLPKNLKGLNVPFLVLSYDKNKLEICGDNTQIATIYVKNIPMPKYGIPPELEVISWTEAYRVCQEYFMRNNYEVRENLLEQITARATKELIPLAQMRRAALITARATTLG